MGTKCGDKNFYPYKSFIINKKKNISIPLGSIKSLCADKRLSLAHNQIMPDKSKKVHQKNVDLSFYKIPTGSTDSITDSNSIVKEQ